ncbi:DNA-binding protein RFX2-like isoform X3 [Lineus longissimus]|uniref:DNA-binding protein RFX2-like isoform X3 n=1 Tax=Lineus longissimus TaxID=88925 RepID=UPI00315D3B99
MADQTYVSEMQAISANTVQQWVGHETTSQSTPQTTTQVVQKSSNQSQTATIIQSAHSGQQFIVTTTVPPENEQSQDTVTLQAAGQTAVYPTHVQYVESPDSTLYAATNGQMQNYPEYSQTTMYTPVGSTYYQTSGTQVRRDKVNENNGVNAWNDMSSTVTPIGSVQGLQQQILTHSGGTYLVQGGTMDGEGHPLTHTTRASPATVQWLIDNYENAEGVSLPRSTLYNHYLRHCHEQKMDPMNPASFGKLIRSVFLGLRTRRLGTRGNSKYYYYGIRIKATSPLNQFTDDQTMAMRQQPISQGKRFKQANCKMEGSDGTESSTTSTTGSHDSTSSQQQHQQFLGDASGALPNFSEIEPCNPLPDGISKNDLKLLEQMYKDHCEAMLDVVVNLQFTLIENLWRTFWRNPEEPNHNDAAMEKRLTKDKLFAMCKYEPVQKFIKKSDYAFYQSLVEVLIPDVLRPIPSSLTQAIRNFAKSLEAWLKNAMEDCPEEMYKTKLGAVTAFAQTLRRYTSLNHLAQAARAVLQNTSQINQMLTDLNRVDFGNVQEQASWVCQCDDGIVTRLEQDFKKTLQQQNSLEQWAVWLEGVVNQVLKPHEGSATFAKAARQFLLKWSFYSSMVIRDLTLRSAASFGSFHLIRLLYDEYMFYLVEHKVAAATGDTPIAVMGECIDFSTLLTIGSIDKVSPQPNTRTITLTGAQALATSHMTNASAAVTSTSNAFPMTLTTQGSLGSNPGTATVTVVATGASTPGTKTIVVVPVSATDLHANKKLKTT